MNITQSLCHREKNLDGGIGYKRSISILLDCQNRNIYYTYVPKTNDRLLSIHILPMFVSVVFSTYYHYFQTHVIVLLSGYVKYACLSSTQVCTILVCFRFRLYQGLLYSLLKNMVQYFYKALVAQYARCLLYRNVRRLAWSPRRDAAVLNRRQSLVQRVHCRTELSLLHPPDSPQPSK